MTSRPLVPLVDLDAAHVTIRAELTAAFDRVLRSGQYASGPEVAHFETELARCVDATHAVGVGSGTAALQLALMAAGIGPGDEVILPANTFFATAEAVVACGAVPIVADVRPETAGIDAASVEAVLTPRTAAIIAVHLYGIPADMGALRAVAEAHGLLLLEDAAQALGARWDGRAVGSLGDAAAFSFYPTKNLGALGEGGAVTTDNQDWAARVRRLRNHGESERHVHVEFGFNERMDELQAALLTVKLTHLTDAVAARARAVTRYTSLLQHVDGVEPLTWPSPAEPAHHLFVVRVPERDAVLTGLRAEGVQAAVHYPTPIHLQPAWRSRGAVEGDLPVVEGLARSILSLPLYPGISDAQVDRCVETLARNVPRSTVRSWQ